MSISVLQDGNYSVKKDDIVFDEGQDACYLSILLQGKVDVYINPEEVLCESKTSTTSNNGFRLFTVDQNAFIGSNDLFGAKQYSYSYRAAADSTLYVFVIKEQAKLLELFNVRKEYPAYIVASISKMIEHSYSALLRLGELTREYSAASDNLSVYFWMCKEDLGFNYAPDSTFFRDNLDNLQKLKDKGYSFFPELNSRCFDADYSVVYDKDYSVDGGIGLDKIEYYKHLTALPIELQKNFFCSDSFITSYLCEDGTKLVGEIQGSIRETIHSLIGLLEKLYSKEKECLFNIYIRTAEEAAKEGCDTKPILSTLDYLVNKVIKLADVIANEYDYKLDINIESLTNLLSMQKLKLQNASAENQAKAIVSANNKVELIPEALKNGVDRILKYSEIPKEKSDLFRANLETFKKMRDKFDLDNDARKVRNTVATIFFEIYDEVFRKVHNEKNNDPLYKMFLDYGYMDENLLELDHIISLYELVNASGASEPSSVYNMSTWLSKIYTKEKDPSINDFNMDYFDVFRDMRKRGEISDDDKPLYEGNMDGRLGFEINNMFKTNHRLCHGQLSVYFPILHNEMITRDLKKSLVTPQVIQESINKLLEVDFSAFHREISYYNVSKGIEKEFVMMPVVPDFILLPVFGTRAIMWQELSGRVRTTPGRFLLPVFTSENIDEMITKLAGHFRWELCKTMMGAAWNDITQSSLTADYTDYVQFFKKNKELSEDAKEKLKSQIQRNRGMMRDIFTSDYETWINYESKGNLRLNKVSRKILFKHCPFAKPIREGLEKHPIYSDMALQFKTIRSKHARDLEVRYSRYSKVGGKIEPELEENLKFYKEK